MSRCDWNASTEPDACAVQAQLPGFQKVEDVYAIQPTHVSTIKCFSRTVSALAVVVELDFSHNCGVALHFAAFFRWSWLPSSIKALPRTVVMLGTSNRHIIE